MEIQFQSQMKQPTRSLLFLNLPSLLLQLTKLVFALALFLSLNTGVYAAINSVNPTPSSASIVITHTATTTIKLNWHISRTELLAIPLLVNISSPSAFLQLNGTTIATLAGGLNATSLLATGQTGIIKIKENFTINPILARRIASSPGGSLKIIRTFTVDNQIFTTGVLHLSAAAGNAAPLSIRRIDLSFENKTRTDVVYKNESIRAVVDLSFRNNGILKAEWRLINPAASLGGIGGRVIQVVRKNLISSGQGRTKIISPRLPTNDNGLYLLAFVIQKTDSSLKTPVLRYFVLDKNNNQQATSLSKIVTLSPNRGVSLSKKTVFSWQKISGAKAYQIEVFSMSNDIPITGKLIQASASQLSLSSFSLKLLSENKYRWRVRAFDYKGQIIGKSDPLTIMRQ